MTAKDGDKYVAGMKKLSKTISSSDSKKLLVKAGICTPKGNLKKPYK